MSDLALCENDELKTASEFHDDYILKGERYEDFVCPFCYIGLVAKAIYIDGPQGKSPHFSCFPKKPHIDGCDGYPLVEGKTVKDAKRTNKFRIGKKDFIFPEKLVPRSESVKANFIDELKNIIDKNNKEDISRRRKKLGTVVGSAKYTSTLIRSFAASKKKIISLVYEYAKTENISNDERKELIKSALTQAPIDLEGHKSNYQDAFRSTMYYSRAKKIWNGKGAVKIRGNVINIISNQNTKYRKDGDEYELSFCVRIDASEGSLDSPGYHRTLIKRLRLARENSLDVRWSAYGEPSVEIEKNGVLLEITNLDHLFVEQTLK